MAMAPASFVGGIRALPRRGAGLIERWGLALPAGGLARARWFYLMFTGAVSLTCVPAIFLSGFAVSWAATAVAGIGLLLAARIHEFRHERLLPGWAEIPQALALAVAATVAGPLDAGLGLFFTGCFFRAVYASTRRTLLTTVGAIGLLAVCASISVSGWERTFISQASGIASATLLTRMLVATLLRQHQNVLRNERLLSTVFDNLDVSIMVGSSADAAGMMNRAARRLNAELGLPEPPARWDSTVRVYGADGLTPLAPEHMPAARALNGEHVRDMAMVLGLDDGSRRYFSVNAAPADADVGAGVIVTVHDVTAQRQAQAELSHLALHDPLTGLGNRTLLTRAITDALETLRPHGVVPAVLLLDVDRFKQVNDSLGHAFGDEVLRAVADRLRSCLRPDTLITRLGGDEFAVLVPDASVAPELARRICQAVSPPMELTRTQVSVSVSIGVMEVRAQETAGTILAAADLAMYAAKAAGRGRVEVFRPDMRDALEDRLLLEADLVRALQDDEFELHYQPFVNLETGEVIGAEALVRWRHPVLGLIVPLIFIPVTEDNGMIIPLGRRILRVACAAAARWQPADPAQIFTMSVNVSARQLDEPGIVEDVSSALAASGLPPRALTLEITEGALADESPALLARLVALRALGVNIAIDDFGTGYSSLSRLRTFPVDVIKIDRSFIDNVEDETGTAMVRAMVALAEALGLDVVAEGVESQGQADALAALRCRVAQGYYFGRPAPAAETAPPCRQPASAASKAHGAVWSTSPPMN